MPRNSIKARQFENEMSAELKSAETNISNYTIILGNIFNKLASFRDDPEIKNPDKIVLSDSITSFKQHVQDMLDSVI